ncbi:GNAT family N-acetyltransferase [Marivibrio halodurans]|uniref:GNAT family N-acetyltransferase n=1 Tax=Marivibrio halodurans TaxID=2039722 RepID=A0A8J7V364_9PROT|nr:GNAT family N-acetyltransferase [Marivibrio halodurans]MBP5857622.1 GNAT family N-acetyltransferase [Marivibrio halodurans]
MNLAVRKEEPPLHASGRVDIGGRETDFVVRVIGAEDLDALATAQQAAAAGIAEEDWDLFHPHPREEIELFLDGEGAIFGLFIDGALAGYCMLGLPRARLGNFADFLPPGSSAVPAEERRLVAHIDGVYVPPDLRGHALQRLLIRVRMDHALARGCRHFLANASPRNTVSGHNMARSGMLVRAVAEMHPTPRGRKLRCLFHKDVSRPVHFDPNIAPVAVPAMDKAAQQALIAKGYLGVDFHRRDGAPMILYARPLAP